MPSLTVRHGVTVDELDRLADVAARTHFSAMLSVEDRADTARYAMTVAVLEAVEPPGSNDLLHVGRDAISRAVTAELHHHGVSTRSPGEGTTGFARYWAASDRTGSPWEDALVETIALGQVWRVLPGWHCAALQALADHGSYKAAAAALGTTDATFKVRISRARAAFRVWWFEHENPPRMWGSDRRTERDRARSVTHTIRARARDRALKENADAA